MFSFLGQGGVLAFRLSKGERAAFLGEHPGAVVEQYGAVMKDYVAVPDAVLEDGEALGELWAVRGERADVEAEGDDAGAEEVGRAGLGGWRAAGLGGRWGSSGGGCERQSFMRARSGTRRRMTRWAASSSAVRASSVIWTGRPARARMRRVPSLRAAVSVMPSAVP